MKSYIKPMVLAGAMIFGATFASAQTTLKLAHAAPESDLQQTMSLFFKEQVEARSNGSIMVNLFPSGQLGNDAQMIDGIRSGIIDIPPSRLSGS